MSGAIQAIIFNKKDWNTKSAVKWLKEKKMKPIKRVHKTENYLRYRLEEPEKFKRFITKNTKIGIKFIIGFY